QIEIAADLVKRLINLWVSPAIPVQRMSLGSPDDVLEVFTRINRGGVQVAGQDLFFAGVKTRWNGAEEILVSAESRLTPVVTAEGSRDPLIDRMGLLRICGRLASRAVRQADLLPLTVDQLSGAHGAAIITALTKLCAPDSQPLARMANVVNLLV